MRRSRERGSPDGDGPGTTGGALSAVAARAYFEQLTDEPVRLPVRDVGSVAKQKTVNWLRASIPRRPRAAGRPPSRASRAVRAPRHSDGDSTVVILKRQKSPAADSPGWPKLVIIRPMKIPGWVAVLVLVAVSSVGVLAQSSWLPPHVEQGLAGQLTERLAPMGSPAAPGTISDGARKTVKAIGEIVGAWTDQVAIARAPAFPKLTVPTANEPLLDAMAGYQVCTFALYLRFESSQDPENRRATALGLTAMTIAILRVRQPFLATGGTDERMEAFLAGEALGPVLEALQQNPALMTHAEEQCQPVLRELLRAPGVGDTADGIDAR